MKSLKLLLTLLGASIMLAACTAATVRTEASGEIKGGRLELSDAPTLIRHGNEVMISYYEASGRLMLRHPDGAELALNGDELKDARSSFNVLHSDGEGLYALWRPKLTKAVEGVGGPGDKLVYFRASLDGGKNFGPIHRLNQKGGAFKPFIASSGKGDLYVAYTDERNSGSDIDIYLNVSHDRGSSWKKEDIQLDGSESRMSFNPSVVADGDRVYVSWMTKTYAKEFKIFVRASADRGETWQAPVAAHVSLDQPATPALIKTGKGLLLCWGDVDAVRCASSADHAKSWSNSVAVEDSKGAAGLIVAADPKGHAHLLIAQKPEQEKARVNLFHVRSADGRVFSKPRRLNGGTPYMASTILPTLDFGDDGSVLATWVDMRYLRPVIAANYSHDGGNTWLGQDVVLGARKGMWNFFPAVAYGGSGKYSIAWQESANRSDPTSLIAKIEYRPGSTGVAMPKPDVARLKERADTFWRLREEGKWEQVYELLDPFFREGSSASVYAKSQGAVKYHGHELVGEPEIDGVRATVQVSYDSEVPELMLKGKKVSVPRTTVQIPQEWIWVDGEWYHVFRDLFGGSTLIE